MAFNFKRAQEAPPQFCIFGKLPRRGDFVRVNATHPAATQLDQLLAQSLLGLESGPEAVERYRATPATSLAAQPRSNVAIAGRDAAQPRRERPQLSAGGGLLAALRHPAAAVVGADAGQ